MKPLAGVRVVELGTLIAGPFCSRILAEFGAEVVKIEAPGEGDPLRKWRKLYPDAEKGTSLWWLVQACNKKWFPYPRRYRMVEARAWRAYR